MLSQKNTNGIKIHQGKDEHRMSIGSGLECVVSILGNVQFEGFVLGGWPIENCFPKWLYQNKKISQIFLINFLYFGLDFYSNCF